MERPYLYIFGVKGPLGEFEVEEPYDYFEYHVANYGKTPAKVENALFRVSMGREPEDPTPATVWHELLKRPILTPGELREAIPQSFPDGMPTQQYVDEHTPPGTLMEPLLDDDQQLFFVVKIRYRGPFSKGHETSVCWRWDRESAKMIEYGEDEYNYTH